MGGRPGAPLSEQRREPDSYRNYEKNTRPGVREFYRLNHRYQTLEFVRAKKAEYLPPRRKQMGIWEAMEFLNTLVDDSDPDTDLNQIEHLLQVAEAIRRDNKPRWFILTGLIHDLGKILCLFGEPQWAVVGDTFPVGCATLTASFCPSSSRKIPICTIQLCRRSAASTRPIAGSTRFISPGGTTNISIR